MVPIHLRDEDGHWQPSEIDWSQDPDWWAGGHGLYSTPRDYLAFQRMLLGRGSLGDVKLLEPETVDSAFANQIGSLDFPPAIATADPASTADFNGGPGLKWGLGLLLNEQDQPGMRARRQRRLGGPVQHPLLGGSEDQGHRRDLHADAPVRRATRLPGLRRLRAGAVRLAVS